MLSVRKYTAVVEFIGFVLARNTILENQDPCFKSGDVEN